MLELHHRPFGENPESITQADFISMVPPKIFTDIQRCIDRKKTITIEHAQDGTLVSVTHLRYSLSPIIESDGSVSGVMGMVEWGKWNILPLYKGVTVQNMIDNTGFLVDISFKCP